MVLQVAHTGSRSADHVNGRALPALRVVYAWVARDFAKVFVLVAVSRGAFVGCLELSVRPLCWVLGLLSFATHFSVEVGAVDGLRDREDSC